VLGSLAFEPFGIGDLVNKVEEGGFEVFFFFFFFFFFF
jgi:hypothetical protein